MAVAVAVAVAVGSGLVGAWGSRSRAARAVTTRPPAAVTPSVVAGLQPRPRARAPASAATTPPTENAAWKADISGLP